MLVKDLIERKSRWLKTAWIHLIERRNLERATALHMTSAVEDREPRRFRFNLPKSQIIPNGIDMPPDTGIHCELSGPVMQALHHQPMILFIGRINWKKGLDKLICAMRQIERGYLVIAGNDEEGYTPFLKQIAETSGVMQRVSFVGPVYGSEKSALLEAASVFPLPSISENFGNAALEAMAVGCTVVVSKETGVADIVRQSGGGVVIDRDALVRNLSTLLSDPSRLKQMGEAARQFVSDNCSWDTVAVKMERFYEVYL
jgi:glycosyltransferase involved in cell wall biosynthesis